MTKIYPWYTPYQFAGNKPVWKIDLDGKEEATPENIAMQATYLTVSAVYDVRNATTNSLLRIAPSLNVAATKKLLREAGVTDNALLQELSSYYNARRRTVVTGSYDDINGNRYEFHERMWVLEAKNSAGREFLEAGLDILSVYSALSGPKGSPATLFAKGGGVITMSQIRRSVALLFNIRHYSSIGINNALKGVHALEDVMEAGMAFVGNNAKKIYTKAGRFEGWESGDGLKRFRPATFKKNQGKIQSNFEQRTSVDVDWDDAKGAKSNMHVDTDRGFDYSAERRTTNSN